MPATKRTLKIYEMTGKITTPVRMTVHAESLEAAERLFRTGQCRVLDRGQDELFIQSVEEVEWAKEI